MPRFGFSRFLIIANSTSSMPPIIASILLIKRVASKAFRFPLVSSSYGISAQNIFSRRNWFQMVWIRAQSVSAKVIQSQSGSNRPNKIDISRSMRPHGFLFSIIVIMVHSIPFTCFASIPKPAAFFINAYMRFKSFSPSFSSKILMAFSRACVSFSGISGASMKHFSTKIAWYVWHEHKRINIPIGFQIINGPHGPALTDALTHLLKTTPGHHRIQIIDGVQA